jgi:hypothetical protein
VLIQGLELNPWFHPLYFTNNYIMQSFEVLVLGGMLVLAPSTLNGIINVVALSSCIESQNDNKITNVVLRHLKQKVNDAQIP